MSYTKKEEKQWTNLVYTLIAQGKTQDAIQILQPQVETFPNGRAALSLLGYCYYYQQDFPSAAKW